MSLDVPHSREAEESVICHMLSRPEVIGEIIGTLIEPADFYFAGNRMLFEEVVERYYADDPVDHLSVAEARSKQLSRLWECDEDTAIKRVRDISQQVDGANPTDHARLVKRHSDYRRLLDLAQAMQKSASNESSNPEQIAGMAAETAMRIATNSISTQEILSFGDLGRNFYRQAQQMIAAREQGMEMGVRFGLKFIDDRTRSLMPSELVISAGEPGIGKSCVWWVAAKKFAERQMRKPVEKRIGTFVLSLEMAEEPSNARLAQQLTGMDSGLIREGKLTTQDLNAIVAKWARAKELPLYFNFCSQLRASQMRALIVEAIRRHNVGLVLIDHFRYFDMDRRYDSKIDEDEDKARFLKEAIAKELQTVVICIAHTTKMSGESRRPTLNHLRGSGQVAAHADFVNFMYRPYLDATAQAIDQGQVGPKDAEMIWAKNRHGLDGAAPFYFDPASMTISDDL